MTAYEMRISDWSSDVCSSDLTIEHSHSMPARVVPLKNEAFALVWFHRDEVKSEYDDDWYGCVHPVEFYPGNMKIYHASLVSAGWEFGEVALFDLFQLDDRKSTRLNSIH